MKIGPLLMKPAGMGGESVDGLRGGHGFPCWAVQTRHTNGSKDFAGDCFMTHADHIAQIYNHLPAVAQQEVMDFMLFLQQHYGATTFTRKNGG